MNTFIRNSILRIIPPKRRESYAKTLMHSIGYGETTIKSEVKSFIKALNFSDVNLSRSVVLDVGASIGDFSSLLLNQTNLLCVYAYEPSKSAAQDLIKRNSKYVINKRLILKNFGLGKKSEVLYLYSNPILGSSHGSLYSRKGNNKVREKVLIRNFKSEISKIREPIIGMKIDTEGHEFTILKSARNLISQKSFKVIQFEFGEYNIHNKENFKQFYDLLTEFNFKLFRISKYGTFAITEYKNDLEVHWNTNYLAIKFHS
jgi:FkbM family methyltransferase